MAKLISVSKQKTKGQNVMRAKQQGVITLDGFAEAGEASEAACASLDPRTRSGVGNHAYA